MVGGMEEGNVGREIGIPWIPVTPIKKTIPLRAGADPPVVKLENGLGSGSGSESESEDKEVEEYPPGFEPKVRHTEPGLLFDVHVNVVDSMRRGNSGFEADDFGGGEGYDAIPIEMGPFSRLLAMADANRLVERYGRTCGRYAGPVSCSCMNCGMEHLGSSSSINHQNWCFPWLYSEDCGCRGIGGLSVAQSLFCEITRPWNALDAVNKEMGPPLTPVTPDKARGLQCRNSEAESLSACDRTNSELYSHENDVIARGSSEEPLKDSQCSTITKASTESQILDKGDTLGIELKTPQKKERRRKHRPKVVKEGKPGRPSSRKRTVDKTGVLSDTPKPKRKYVRRKGIENARTGSQEGQDDSTNQETVKSEPVKKSRGRKPKVNVDGGTNPNPSADNPVRKRKYVRKKKGVGNDNATSLAEVPRNLTYLTILDNNTSRKSCRRGLNFGSEGLTGEGNDDQTTRVPAKHNNEAGCTPFSRRKRTRTQLFSSTASDKVKWSSELTDEKATEEGRCENFQNAVLTGGEAAMAPIRKYSDPVVDNPSGSHCSSFQAHRYWALSLSNLQKRITVNDGHYSILESDVSAANHELSGGPSRLISFHQEGGIQFPSTEGQTDSCSVQVAGAAMSSESSYQYPAEYMYSHVGIASEAQTSGSYPEVVWNFSSCMNDLMKQLWKLNINKKGGRRKNQKQCALASYDIIYQQYNALVLYRPAGSIVPFGNSSSEPKRRQQRAKVELDNETIKVWQLLLENIDNKGIDGTDEQKAKWWEEERAVFQGRADSFIARMRLVQGDRRFSPWKGSVLDSVVGVFLTQNVSDHLSSSAFMALAARYPLKSCQNKYSDEGTNSVASDCPVSNKEESNGLIPPKDVKEASCENNANIQNKTSCRNFDGIALEAKITPSFTQLLNMANEGVQSDKHSTCPNEELKHDFAGFPHFCGEESESTPSSQSLTPMDQKTPRRKSKSSVKEEIQEFDWDSLRKKVEACGRRTARTPDTMDSLDWEALRHDPVSEVADAIKERGMNNRLAERIQDFLNRVVRDHKRLDLEWLRDIPPDKAKEYLLSFRGLGLKSVECVRLLTLHHLAFPVDTNVGRIAVRLGWVPLQPLPESLQLHLLEMYPILESIQQYLWPRLCKLDQGTLYELHYQMITFGKVFCTKSKPNCNACPMRGECRHFASAFASARLALPASEQSTRDGTTEENTRALDAPGPLPLPSPPEKEVIDIEDLSVTCRQTSCQPIIEEPASPEPECLTSLGNDPEESIAIIEDDDEIPTIRLNMEEFSRNLQMYMQENMATQEDAMSKALVALTPEAASVPVPPLKGYSRLRTEHLVYEIPEGHALLNGLDKLEPDDPCRYLLAIWTPGETATSIRPPERGCTLEGGQLCEEPSCSTCNGVRETNSQIVRGTILIPCRTAMRGSFPLNGTYFQVNEVFADHESSINPLNVPRSLIWNLHRRTVYFGTSISAIFKGLSTEAIQHCFWRGYVCMRGFDRKTRAPRPLMARLHFPASKMAKAKGKTNNE